MKVVVSGSSGFIGTALVPFLVRHGDRVVRLVRSPSAGPEDTIRWDPAAGSLAAAAMEGVDAVVHLAGENVGSGRWNEEKKRRIVESRVGGTSLLCEGLAALRHPPRVLVSASGGGYYGSRGDEILTEESGSGEGPLPDLVRRWEAATEPARRAGIRVVLMRIGLVLHPAGGALAKMLPLFRIGLGGNLGGGDQYFSWIARDDLVGLIRHALTHETLAGPLNAVAPHPIRNRDFTRVLAGVLGRPAFFTVPAVLLRLLLREMAEETVLASQRIIPGKATESGYRFLHPDLEGALRQMLRQPAPE